MTPIIALLRASWLSASSYRTSMVLSLASLVLMLVPLHFVAGAVQPVMARAVGGAGHDYFAFALLGSVTYMLASTALNALPGAIGTAIGMGTFEAFLATPAGAGRICAGLTIYGLAWSVARAILLLAGGVWLGVHLQLTAIPLAAVIVLLVMIAYGALGLVATALVLTLRTAGPLLRAVSLSSMLLGGVYLPMQLVPHWVRALAALVPLSYGLGALRAVLLQGAGLQSVGREIAMLAAMSTVLGAVGLMSLRAALDHARRQGTLSQY